MKRQKEERKHGRETGREGKKESKARLRLGSIAQASPACRGKLKNGNG